MLREPLALLQVHRLHMYASQARRLCLPQQDAKQTAWSTAEVQCRLHALVYIACFLSCFLLLHHECQAVVAGEHAEGGTYIENKRSTIKLS